jgi:hypothetical protein
MPNCTNCGTNYPTLERTADGYDQCTSCANACLKCIVCGGRYVDAIYTTVRSGLDDGVAICHKCAITYKLLPQALRPTTFIRNPFKRWVGIELEFLLPNATKLPRGLFKLGHLKYDGSIRPVPSRPGYGVEFASAKAQGDTLIDMIHRACRTIHHAKGWANESCGAHIHIDMSASRQPERDRIKEWWRIMEPVFFALVPSHRRTQTEYARTTTTDPMWPTYETNSGHGGDRARYFALNLTAYARYGSFENRLHQGTITPRKLIEWVMLNLHFFDAFRHIDPPDASTWDNRTKLSKFFTAARIPLTLRKQLLRRLAYYNRPDARGRVYFNIARIARVEQLQPPEVLPPPTLTASLAEVVAASRLNVDDFLSQYTSVVNTWRTNAVSERSEP